MDPLRVSTAPAPESHAFSAAFPNGGSLLLIGNDGGLRYSRRLLLERAGFTVVSLNSQEAMAGEIHSGCRLVLLCRSVGHREALLIAQWLHATQPSLPILRFATQSELPSAEFAVVRRDSASPPVLLAEVARLLLSLQPVPTVACEQFPVRTDEQERGAAGGE